MILVYGQVYGQDVHGLVMPRIENFEFCTVYTVQKTDVQRYNCTLYSGMLRILFVLCFLLLSSNAMNSKHTHDIKEIKLQMKELQEQVGKQVVMLSKQAKQAEHMRKQAEHMRKQDEHMRKQAEHMRKQAEHMRKQAEHLSKQAEHLSKQDDKLREQKVRTEQLFAECARLDEKFHHHSSWQSFPRLKHFVQRGRTIFVQSESRKAGVKNKINCGVGPVFLAFG
jgi:ribosomal protein L11 methylase PrmA